jgi:hypothetical protein
MNITRDNYEMLFLMYVDNELSAAERQEVKIFAENNTDLANELETLQLTRLSIDNDIFVPKTLLYRNATEVENVQESLLLHLDGELSKKDIVTVEEQIQSNTLVEEEWLILRKTKLQKVEITFPGKASLYRNEGRTLYIDGFKRIAAAITGLGMFFAAALLFNKPVSDPIAVKPTDIEQIIPGNPPESVSKNTAKPLADSRKNIQASSAKSLANSVDPSVAPPVPNADQKVLVQKIKPENGNLATTSHVKRDQKQVQKEMNETELPTNTEALTLIPKAEVQAPIYDEFF